MEAGKISPIVAALRSIGPSSAAEIRVHVSRRLWDWRTPLKRAQKLFLELESNDHARSTGVLIYVNLRLRQFSVVFDQALLQSIPPGYWESECNQLSEEFAGTHPETAIARSVERIGKRVNQDFSQNH